MNAILGRAGDECHSAEKGDEASHQPRLQYMLRYRHWLSYEPRGCPSNRTLPSGSSRDPRCDWLLPAV